METAHADLLDLTAIRKNVTTISTLSAFAWIATGDHDNQPSQTLIENAFALIHEECEQIIKRLNQDNPQ